jgi:uncharacterized membrane protein (DUF4010 family)
MQVESLQPLEIALGFALALAVGGAVGLERERHAHVERKPTFGGARTFPLVAVFGALLALLGRAAGGALPAAGLLALAALLGVSHWNARRATGELQLGLTAEVAALVVFVLGALPFVELDGVPFAQRMLLAGALGAAVMALLALRRPIHEFAERISYEDVLASVRFALVALIALPLLPDLAYGPYAVLNPFRIGVVIVLIAGISYVGYVAVRLYGARKGLAVTAIAGGLVSSTAVTLTFSARSREHPELTPACALAVALAATIMFARVLVEIAAVQPALVGPAALPVGSMLAVASLGCLVLWRRQRGAFDGAEPTRLHNPCRLRTALRLGLMYAAVRLLAALAWEHLGRGGLLASAALSGLADVDAITLSVAHMHRGGLEQDLAVNAVTLAAATNTAVKVGLCAALGGPALARAVASVLLPAVALGCLVAFVA